MALVIFVSTTYGGSGVWAFIEEGCLAVGHTLSLCFCLNLFLPCCSVCVLSSSVAVFLWSTWLFLKSRGSVCRLGLEQFLVIDFFWTSTGVSFSGTSVKPRRSICSAYWA